MKLTLEEWIRSRFSISYERAQEIAQEARLIAFLKKGISSDQEGIEYLQGVATYLVLNERRKNKRRQTNGIEVALEEVESCRGGARSFRGC